MNFELVDFEQLQPKTEGGRTVMGNRQLKGVAPSINLGRVCGFKVSSAVLEETMENGSRSNGATVRNEVGQPAEKMSFSLEEDGGTLKVTSHGADLSDSNSSVEFLKPPTPVENNVLVDLASTSSDEDDGGEDMLTRVNMSVSSSPDSGIQLCDFGNTVADRDEDQVPMLPEGRFLASTPSNKRKVSPWNDDGRPEKKKVRLDYASKQYSPKGSSEERNGSINAQLAVSNQRAPYLALSPGNLKRRTFLDGIRPAVVNPTENCSSGIRKPASKQGSVELITLEDSDSEDIFEDLPVVIYSSISEPPAGRVLIKKEKDVSRMVNGVEVKQEFDCTRDKKPDLAMLMRAAESEMRASTSSSADRNGDHRQERTDTKSQMESIDKTTADSLHRLSLIELRNVHLDDCLAKLEMRLEFLSSYGDEILNQAASLNVISKPRASTSDHATQVDSIIHVDQATQFEPIGVVDQSTQIDRTASGDQATQTEHSFNTSDQCTQVCQNLVDQGIQATSMCVDHDTQTEQTAVHQTTATQTTQDETHCSSKKVVNTVIDLTDDTPGNASLRDAEEIAIMRESFHSLQTRLQEKDAEIAEVRKSLTDTERVLVDTVKAFSTTNSLLERINSVPTSSSDQSPIFVIPRAHFSGLADLLPRADQSAIHPNPVGMAALATQNLLPVTAATPNEIPRQAEPNVAQYNVIDAVLPAGVLPVQAASGERQHVDGVYVDAFPLKPEILQKLVADSYSNPSTFVGKLMKYAFNENYLAEKSFTRMEVKHRDAVIDATLQCFPSFVDKDAPGSRQPTSRPVVKQWMSQKFSCYKQEMKRKSVKTEAQAMRKANRSSI